MNEAILQRTQSESAEPPLPRKASRRRARLHAARTRRIQVLRALRTGIAAGILLVVAGVGILAIVVPTLTASTPLTVMTSSMEPTLPPGTMIVIRPVDVADIVPGDIITYQLRSGEPEVVTHRVTQQLTASDGSPRFVTQGDNNPAPDPNLIHEAQVQGELWYALPLVGWISLILPGDARSTLITVAVVLLLLYAVWMVVGSIRERSSSRTQGNRKK